MESAHDMNRRAFLSLVAAAPLVKALAPLRLAPPSPAVTNIIPHEYGLSFVITREELMSQELQELADGLLYALRHQELAAAASRP